MLIPLVSLPSPLPEEASEWVADAARLAVAGPLCVILPNEHADARGVACIKPLLRIAPAAVELSTVSPAHVELATQLLDSGALTVIFSLTIDHTDSTTSASIGDIAEAISSFPRTRVEIRIDAPPATGLEHIAAAMTALRALSCGFIVTVDTLALSSTEIRQLQQVAAGNRISLSLRAGSVAGLDAAEVGRLHKNDVSVIQAACIAKNMEENELYAADGKLDVGSCLAQCVRSDRPDGLFTTIVSDEFGKALGLVYSSQESILEAVRCGRGVYYSRSRYVELRLPHKQNFSFIIVSCRGGLWRKGDTSGCWQALRSIRLDCDSDALIFSVKQMGTVPAFCHLNTRTCWGEDGGLTALEVSLQGCIFDLSPGCCASPQSCSGL